MESITSPFSQQTTSNGLACCHTQLLTTYGNIIAEHEAQRFIDRVEDVQLTGKAHYIPHNTVKKRSATTTIRIFYDCSLHSSPDNPSLNNCLLVGQSSLNNKCPITLQFCTFTYSLSTDIKTAFLHSGLDKGDRDLNRFSGFLTLRSSKSSSKYTASRLSCLVLPAPFSC